MRRKILVIPMLFVAFIFVGRVLWAQDVDASTEKKVNDALSRIAEDETASEAALAETETKGSQSGGFEEDLEMGEEFEDIEGVVAEVEEVVPQRIIVSGEVDVLVKDWPRFEGRVTKVESGDTLYIDGKMVYLLGVDAPRRWWWNEPRDCYSGEIADFVESTLLDQTVTYAYDPKIKERLIKGKHLVYLFLGERFINKELIERGMAFAKKSDNITLKDKFLELEKWARFYEFGFWHHCAVECSPQGTRDKCRVKDW